MTGGECPGQVKIREQKGKKHEIPRFDSAAGKNAALLTERREDEALEVAKKSQPLTMTSGDGFAHVQIPRE